MAEMTIKDLRIEPRKYGYARGQEGLEQILFAALSILIDEGYRALSFRRIAAESGLKLGNITYYFPTKEDLIRTLLDAVITPYEEAFDRIVHEEGSSPEQMLEEYISLVLRDITSKKTTRLFPELWALSNHDAFIAERVDELYARARATLSEIIGAMNPALADDERDTLALVLSASMEGQTIFAGFKKPWEPRMAWIERIMSRAFVDYIKQLKPGDISRESAR